jgi:hypothetical protein
MSVPQPASVTLTISGLINKVKAFLQNRSDVDETQDNPEMRPSAWIRDALREITASWPFPELQKPGPLTTIGPGLGWLGSNYSYPVSQFLYPGDDMTLSEDPVIFLTPGQAAQGGLTAAPVALASTSNLVGYSMDYYTVKAITPLLFIPGGIPFRYTRYGNQFWFGSQPGQNYNVYLPYQVRHPFSADLPQSRIHVPEDWFDIVAYAAAERGAAGPLRWNEQATFIHQILYGDPKYQASGGEEGRPGLIAAKIFQPERDRRLSPVTITVGSERY